MDPKYIKKLREIDTNDLASDLSNIFRKFSSESTLLSLAAAYVLKKATESVTVDLTTVDRFLNTANINDELAAFITNSLVGSWDEISAFYRKYDQEKLMAFILFHENYDYKFEADHTPTSLSHLAAKLMGITDNDSVADFGTGRGSFIRDCFEIAPYAKYYGNDVNTGAKMIATIRAELLGANITIKQENIFDMNWDECHFDKVFSNYPFGMRIRDVGYSRENIQRIMTNYNVIKKSVSSDWLFNAILVESLDKNGKAVGIMTNGSTWNSLDKEVRKYFLEQGFIETVIALPEKIFESTSIGTTMILFSHGNKEVMLVDARGLCEKGRRINIIKEENVNQILESCVTESKYSKRLTYNELAENDFVINPTRYMEDNVAIENGIPFEKIIKNITRGAQLTAVQLDELVSTEPTNYQYLMLSNIKDGMIDEELPYMTDIDPKYEKYCLKDNVLILSKNGYPFKVAVANIPQGKKILANGNLYVIELDENLADPYFIKAFLESDKGVASLRSITVGATIPNIGIEQLKKMLVPFTNMVKQKEIAAKYLATLDEITLLRRKAEKAADSLKHIFDLSEEG